MADSDPPASNLTNDDHELRTAILAAAVDELWQWGIERFTIGGVSARANVDVQSIYRYWDGEDQLALDALANNWDSHVSIHNTGSLRGDLVRHLESVAEYLNTPLGRSLLRTSTIAPKNWEPANIRDLFWKKRVKAMQAILNRAAARNELRQNLDPNIILQLLIGPLFLRGLYSNDPIDTAELCSTIADLVWRAVRATADRYHP